MSKKNILYFLSITILIISLIIFYILNNNYTNFYSKKNQISSINSIETNSKKIMTTPNTTITFITNYLKCNHLKETTVNIPLKFINMTKETLMLHYPHWNLINFSSNNIKLSKSINEFCNEHFYVQSNSDGYINIYNINSNGSKILKEKTKIAIKFLSNSDIKELTKGKEIYGYNNLISYIENFE